MPRYLLNSLNTVQLTEFQEWTDEYGMMTDNDRGDVGGNGNLCTAHYAVALSLSGLLSVEEKERITKVYLNNFKKPGLLIRAPSKPNDREAHDDYFGLLGADSVLNPKNRTLTRLAYDYGKNNYCDGIDTSDETKLELNTKTYKWLTKIFGKVRWAWNNVTDNKFHVSSWLGRRMELIATMQMCLQERINPFYWLYWAFAMLYTAYFTNKEERDSFILAFHSAIAVKGYGFLTDKICQAIHNAIKRDYGDMGQLLSAYYQKPDHPIVKFFEGKF